MKRYSTTVRQRQIIRAALDIIADAGQEGLTMRRIAEKVGVTDAAIYKHFNGKKDILVTMTHYIQQDLADSISRHTWKSGNPARQLKELVRYFFQFLEQHHGVPHVLFFSAINQQDSAYTQSILEILEQTLALFRSKIEAAQQCGLIRQDIDQNMIALLILGNIQSEITLWYLREDPPPLGQGLTKFWCVLQKGIGVSHGNKVS